jgi:hypothetical protein
LERRFPMSVTTRERGSTSVAALALLILLAAVTAGALLLLKASLSYEKRSVAAESSRNELEESARRVVKALTQDPTPDSDSPFDPIWESVGHGGGAEMSVGLRDISSAVDLNWVQKHLLQKTKLGDCLRPGRTAEELQQRREDLGFSTDIEAAYGDLFLQGTLDRYFTGYGIANINITDEFALRKLAELRTGDPARANELHARVQDLLMQKRVLKQEELGAFLGSDYDALSPLMGVQPVWNVHYLDPVVLVEVLSHPDLKIPHPQETAEQILFHRDAAELTADDLARIVGAGAGSRIYQYLGVTTWFWRVIARRGSARAELIAARLPGEKGSRGRFAIIEEKYQR